MIIQGLLTLALLNAPMVDMNQAVRLGHIKKVKAFIQTGYPLNQLSSNDYSPLMYAVLRDQEPLVNLFLKSGADPSLQNNRGQHALLLAAKGGQEDLVRLLTQAGGSVHQWDKLHYSPLMWAAYWGHLKIVKYLLTKNVSLNQRGKDGNSALSLLLQGGRAGQLSTQQKYIYKQESGRVQRFTSPDFPLVQLLLKSGAAVNIRNKQGESPLILATQRQALDVVSLLLKKGADPTVKDNIGKRAIDYAKDLGVKALLEKIKKHPKKNKV